MTSIARHLRRSSEQFTRKVIALVLVEAVAVSSAVSVVAGGPSFPLPNKYGAVNAKELVSRLTKARTAQATGAPSNNSTRPVTVASYLNPKFALGTPIPPLPSRSLVLSSLRPASLALATAPTIASISPNAGAIFSFVTIAGSGFGATQGSSTVKFNGTVASISSWSDTSILAQVVTGTTTGPVVVTVSGQSATGPTFTVTPPPSVSSVSPTSGTVGSTVTINGANFGSSPGNGSVIFISGVTSNGTTAPIVNWSPTSITVTVPAGATTGTVAVTAAGGINSNAVPFEVVPLVGITGLQPNSGTSGTTVTISGSGFGSTQGSGSVTFNGVAASISSWSNTAIVATVPSGATTGNIVVSTGAGNVSGGAPFTVIKPGGMWMDQVVSVKAVEGMKVIATPSFSTHAANEVLLAFVSSSGASVQSVTGGGLTWTKVTSSPQGGTVEVWRAFAPSVLTNITVTVQDQWVVDNSDAMALTVVSFVGADISGTNGSGAIGAIANNSSAPSSASATLTTTRDNSLVFALGIDTTNPATVSPAANQTVLNELTSTCDPALVCDFIGTAWVQQLSTPVLHSGTAVTMSDATSPNDPVGFIAVEVLPAATPPIQAPTITSLSVAAGAPGSSITITGVNFGATQGTSTVSINGTPATPSSWSPSSIVAPVPIGATTGNVVVSVGGQASNSLRFIVTNSAGLAVDQTQSFDGFPITSAVSPFFSTTTGNQLLLGFIASSGSSPVLVNSVTGGGLTWSLVQRTNTQQGTAEIWSAFSPFILNNFAVTANLSNNSFNVSMSLVGFLGVDNTGANGSGAIGATGSGNAASGAPSATLTSTRNNSMVFGTGVDPLGAVARTPASNQSLVHQIVNVCTSSTGCVAAATNTLWVQQLNASVPSSGTSVTINDTAPTTDSYNLSIVEVRPPAVVAPSITSLSPNAGPVGTVVTITGANFGATQGASTVTFASVTAVPSSWSSTSIVVPVPASVPLGPAAVVVTVPGAGASQPATFTVVAPLAITASAAPAPNTAHWNNTNVTISYTCTGGVTPVQCPASQTVTTEGANQSFTATATDANNNAASVTTTLNIDKTPPALAITSPANNTTVTSSPVQVSGTVTDNLSGVASVACNSAAATVQSGTFSCSVALAPGANTISVLAFDVAGNSATRSITVTLGPAITDFNPKVGPAGTAVSIVGTNLSVPPNATTVTFAGPSGPLTAKVNFSSATQLAVVVPTGAVTGPITISNAAGTASTATPFTVGPSQDFQVTVAPATATLPQGSVTSLAVSVSSAQSSFTQLATLSVSGMPQGVAVTFNPPQITAGASSTLLIDLGASTLAVGTFPFTIHATATVAGAQQDRTAGATLNVTAAGQTTLAGQVVTTLNQPIVGATVSLDGLSVLTDGAGRFLLTGIQPGTGRPLSIDGHSATSPNATFPLIFEPVNIIIGRANVVSTPFHLPPIDTSQEVTINPNADTVAGNAAVPGLQMTIPKGANLRMLDGTLVTRTSITPLAPDRTPAPLPSTVGTNIVYTSQPGGAITSIPIPVVYPNLAGLNPGTEVNLWAFDHAHVNWFIYGKGQVSTDGRTINPEINPATGQPFGLPDFSWHFPDTGPNGNPGRCDGSPSCNGPNPVDYSTGMKIENVQQVSWGGARGGIDFSLVYTTDKAQNCDSCPFGRGWTHNWDLRLSGSFAPGGAGRFVAPGEVTGRLFSSAGIDSSGSPRFTSTVGSTYLGFSIVARSSTTQFVDRHGTTWNFDSSGRLTSKVDPNGNATTLTYSGGLLQRITDPVGRSLSFTYDSSNRIVSMTDSIGRTWHYTYEGTPGVAGVPGLTTITDPAGHVMRYTYVTGGRLASVIDPRGNTVKQITYDANGRVASQTFADGGTETYTYQLSGTIVTNTVIRDPLGNVTSKRFDGNSYVLANTDAAGQTITYTRDLTTSQPRFSIGACNCAQTANTYDSSGNLTFRVDRLGNQTSWTFDPKFNRVTVYTDKLGNKTTYGYDAKGNLLGKTDVLGGQETYVLDQFGETTTITDTLGHSAHFEYDQFGNLTAITDALQNRATATFDGVGRITSRVDPLGRKTTYTYDVVNEITSSVDPAGGTSFYTYDENGNSTSVTDPLGNRWTKSYDAKNRLVATTDPLGRTTRYKYDLNDRAVAVVTPENRTASVTYNSRGLVATRSDASGAITTYGYDDEGHRTSITDPKGNTTTYTYDLLGNIVGSRDPLGKQTTDTYDAQSNLVLHVDRLGRSTSFKYDALNRVSSVVLPDATITYTYDAASRPVRIDDTESGSIQWVYDDANRLISAVQTAGTVQYTYSAAGQRTSMTVANRQPVNYAYDSAGRVSTISQGTDIFTYTYNAASDVISLQRPNGVTTTYSYDSNRSLIEVQHGASGAIEDFRYTYTPDNFIASISSLASAPLLASATTVGAADPANRISTSGADTLAYDDQGQSTGKSNSLGPTQYVWDVRGRLTQVILPNSQSVTYQYDPLGRRISRTANGITSQFLYDGLEVALDENSDGSTVEYLNGLGIDKKLRQVSSSSGPLYFLRDHLGSTVALLGPTGSVVERIQYDAYGASSGSAFTRYLYTGREFDSATGLIFSRARYYDPKLQRFLGEDPVGPGTGTNFYEYCNGNPVQCIDPTGLQTEPPEDIEPEPKPEEEPAKPENQPNRGGPRRQPESVEELGRNIREQEEREEREREEAFRKKEEEFYKRHPEGPKEGVCYVNPGDEEFAKLVEALRRFADPFGEGARYRALGTEPGTGKYRLSEEIAAYQFEAQTGMKLTRNPDRAYDWTTPVGGKLATVDAVGGLESENYNKEDFENAIQGHLNTQGLDFVAVSTAGLTPEQTAQVQAYVNSLPPSAQARIVFLGSH